MKTPEGTELKEELDKLRDLIDTRMDERAHMLELLKRVGGSMQLAFSLREDITALIDEIEPPSRAKGE